MSSLNSKNQALTLTLSNITVEVGNKTILKDISLTFDPQTIYTVIGPSGTGKSTLMNVLSGLIPTHSGTILYGETPYQATKHVLGLVPQNYGLLPWETAWKTVTSNVKISQKKRKLTREEEQKIQELFTAMNLESVKHSYPSQMSGGQQQRVSITRAFGVDGDLLLMDEPFSALDAFTREKTQELFLETWKKHPVTTFFITHDIEEALLLGHKIVVMKGQPGEIYQVVDVPASLIEAQSLAEKRRLPDFYERVNTLREEIQS
ncbi:NitT/TauT family transport system ATP-binding protein [Enterococcus sp. AZ194]|uniref:ABC transporter ATP-binding protein n=1 Tax=Enterococcus sp. AZ194 TaxID=2774629 RepID=UPI003F2963A0